MDQNQKGIRFVAEALRGEDFPMDRHGIDYSVGDMEIEDGFGGFIPVRDLTDHLGEKEFASEDDVITALQGLISRLQKRGKIA